mmetsp:Transcript_16060/g.27194  ORF Transcript_16060/g.27194 Transcript_16060/m.27194 type:complete len:246 (-) Transcript_16060:70-807(-)
MMRKEHHATNFNRLTRNVERVLARREGTVKAHTSRQVRITIVLLEENHLVLDHLREVIPTMTLGSPGGEIVMSTSVAWFIVVIKNIIIGLDEGCFVAHGQIIVLDGMVIIDASPSIQVQEPTILKVFFVGDIIIETFKELTFGSRSRCVGVNVGRILCAAFAVDSLSTFPVADLMMEAHHLGCTRCLTNESLNLLVVDSLDFALMIVAKISIAERCFLFNELKGVNIEQEIVHATIADGNIHQLW